MILVVGEWSSNVRIANMLLFFLVFSGNCLKAQQLDPYKYFPSNVGDRWEYSASTPGLGYTILRDSIDINDSSRFIFTQYPPTFMGAAYRIHDNNVYYLPQLDNWLLYKLDANVGESWIVRASEGRIAKVFNISQQLVFGRVTTVKAIGYFKLTGSDTVITENSLFLNMIKIAYGFGKIADEDGVSQPYLLRGCRINGITYGTVDVEGETKNLPLSFNLYQNYPNPFNPDTRIIFVTPEKCHIKLRVYDLFGREIAVIADGIYEPGEHEVSFRADKLASGTYFYSLLSGHNSITKKMLLIK